MKKKITRREFVQTTAAAAATVAIVPAAGCSVNSSTYDPKGLPTVKLGSTGVQVPLMGFGCGSRWMAIEDDNKALGLLEYALDHGLYYWDTAASYGNEQISSEERIGMILKENRDQVFLVSKTGERDADKARESIERSLTRLQTDHLDLLHIHAVESEEDAALLGEEGKVLEVLKQYKREGIIRHIGFTGHSSAAGMKKAAELHDFDVMMMALNHQSSDGSQKFEEDAGTYAFGKGMGVVAMKVIRPRETVDGLPAADLFNYALTLSEFHMINVGIDSLEVLAENIRMLKEYKPLDREKMEEVRLALEPFYQGLNLAWMQPGY